MRDIKAIIQPGDRLGEYLERGALRISAGLARPLMAGQFIDDRAGDARLLKGCGERVPQGVEIAARLILPDRLSVGREGFGD
jgi:hypothetical protein